VACQCGHMDVVKELVNRGAKVNTHMKDKATPLFIAAQNGHYKVLVFLLAQGANIDASRTDGATPLWIAAQMGHDHIVAQLLKAGARVDSARYDGATAIFKASHKGHSAVVGELLRYKPSLGLLLNGESALHAAALSGSLPVCKQLIAAGADPNLKNQEGFTAAEVAQRHKHNVVNDYLRNCANRQPPSK
jgi:ankyrin repeat protein